jgi:HTH-type transcriptional regulator/antitoxin HigA
VLIVANGRRNAGSKNRPARIRTEAELDRTIQEIDSLLDQGKALPVSTQQRLESLSDSVRQYESRHHPIPQPVGADILRQLLVANELTARQCAAVTGVACRSITAFLAGKRGLTSGEATKIALHFRLEPSIFGDAPRDNGKQ